VDGKEIAKIDVQVVAAMEPYRRERELLQTIPGLDKTGAAMLLSEIGADMGRFENKDSNCSWMEVRTGSNGVEAGNEAVAPAEAISMFGRSCSEAANSVVRTESRFTGLYEGLTAWWR